MVRTFPLAREKGMGKVQIMFYFKSWASSMRHLPMGRGNIYMNVAILTDNSFPSELRANPIFSKVSKLHGKFPGVWNTNRCSWSPMTKIDTHSVYSHSSGWDSGDGWVVLTLHVKQIWCQMNQKEETYWQARLCFTAYFLFSQRLLYLFPCLNLLSCVECCRSSSKGMVLSGGGFQALAQSAPQN